MIKDRGNIKWSSLMLSEHREKLKELFYREDERERPELDEQKREELDSILKKAVCQQLLVRVVYYQNRQYKELMGIIKGYDQSKKSLIITFGKNENHLKISDIIDLTI